MKYMYKHKVLKIAYHYESAVIQIPEETREQANDIIKIEGFHLHIIVIDAVLLFKAENRCCGIQLLTLLSLAREIVLMAFNLAI